MFGRCRTPWVGPSLLMFRIDRHIARISSSLCCTGSLAVDLSHWRRYYNRMDSYRVSAVDVPEPPIASSVTPCIVIENDGVLYHHVGPTSFSSWTHSCVLRHRATSILIQERCSSFVNMVLERSHNPYENQRSTHCSRLTEYCRRCLH